MIKTFTFTGHDDAWYLDIFDKKRAEYLPSSQYTFISQEGEFGSKEGYSRKFKLNNPDVTVEYKRKGPTAEICVEGSISTFLAFTRLARKYFKK
jgi:hypothetical protein